MIVSYTNINEHERFVKEFEALQKVGYIGSFMQRAAALYGSKIALIYENKSITYQELFIQTCTVSIIAQNLGIKARDRVLLLCENNPAFYAAYYGILQIGGVIVPLNTFLHEREIVHIIQDANPSLIIVQSNLREKIGSVSIPIITEREVISPLITPSVAASFEITPLNESEMAILLYTSGTTGFPKGVMLSSLNCMTNIAQAISRVSSINHNERLLGVLPFFHSFAQVACIWGAIWVGCTVIIVDRIERKKLLASFEHEPTVFFGVPALFGLLCLLKTVPVGTITYFVSGGDVLSDKIRMAFALLYGRSICNGYGLTEASPMVSAHIEDELVSSTTVGHPFYGIECELRDESGNQLEMHSIGELWIRGANVMLGYYNDPQATEAVLQKGWLRTGDLASFDSKGRLKIVGRVKDLIIHKGIKIYPQEIELILLKHPNVLMAAVVGKEDQASGEIPIAYLQLKKEQEGIEQELRDLCAQNCAPYKVPKAFYCSTKNLPLTSVGKIDKKSLNRD